MKRSASFLFAASLTTIVATVGPDFTTAAENAVTVQDLMNVRASGQVRATWTRHSESYTLQVVMDKSKPRPQKITAANLGERPSQGPVAAQIPIATTPQGPVQNIDRGSFFIGNTIANLRGTDPWIACGRTLTLIEGRRMLGEQPRPPPIPAPVDQSYPPKAKESRVEVWLLTGDGTQILPQTYSCIGGEPYPPVPSVEISYRFSAADSAQAMAAAIRIDDDYFIEKLLPLEFKLPGQ
jgi:hypothetical protein